MIMRVRRAPDRTEQRLSEYEVGTATASCVFPGIQQCFAIAGRLPTSMLCTHVSPGASAEEIELAFLHMRNMDGQYVSAWYVVGPCQEHFSTAGAQWRNVADIKRSFKENIGRIKAEHWLIDVGSKRARFSWGIDVEATMRAGSLKLDFQYRQAFSRADWTTLRGRNRVRF